MRPRASRAGSACPVPPVARRRRCPWSSECRDRRAGRASPVSDDTIATTRRASRVQRPRMRQGPYHRRGLMRPLCTGDAHRERTRRWPRTRSCPMTVPLVVGRPRRTATPGPSTDDGGAGGHGERGRRPSHGCAASPRGAGGRPAGPHPSRTRLLERIRGDTAPVIVVEGPAGSGKSTLLTQLVLDDPRPCAWLTIETRHSDPVLLVGALSRALADVHPMGPLADRGQGHRRDAQPGAPDACSRRAGRADTGRRGRHPPPDRPPRPRPAGEPRRPSAGHRADRARLSPRHGPAARPLAAVGAGRPHRTVRAGPRRG